MASKTRESIATTCKLCQTVDDYSCNPSVVVIGSHEFEIVSTRFQDLNIVAIDSHDFPVFWLPSIFSQESRFDTVKTFISVIDYINLQQIQFLWHLLLSHVFSIYKAKLFRINLEFVKNKQLFIVSKNFIKINFSYAYVFFEAISYLIS